MRYFLLQIKKVCKALPFLLITTLVLTGILGLLALAQTREAQADEGRQKIRLGIVGDAEDEFVKNGISLLQEMDSSRFTCTIEQMTETEARQEAVLAFLGKMAAESLQCFPFWQARFRGIQESSFTGKKICFRTDGAMPGP